MTDFALYKEFAHHYFGVVYDSFDAYCANYKAYMCHAAHDCRHDDCYFAHSEKEIVRAICMNYYNGRCDRHDCRYTHKKSLPLLPLSLERKIQKLLKIQKRIEGEETYILSKKRKLSNAEDKLSVTEDKLCEALDRIENMKDVIQTLRDQNASLVQQLNETSFQKASMKAEFDHKLNMLSAGVNNVMGNLYAQVQAQAQLTQRAVMPKPPPLSVEQTILTQSVIDHYKQLLMQAQK